MFFTNFLCFFMAMEEKALNGFNLAKEIIEVL
jgi:hypothetical protein